MFSILKAYGLPDIKTHELKFYHQIGKTDKFDILADVLQGDTLAPYLFTIVLDYVMREAT